MYLNSSLSTFSSYTQLSTVITGYSQLSEKPLLIQPQYDLQVSGTKVWLGDGIVELPGQQKLEALWDGRGRRSADSWQREHAAPIQQQPVFCQKYSPDMMFPRIRNLRGTSNFRPERGFKDLLTSQYIYSLQVNAGKVNGKMTEQKGFVVLAEPALESERPKTRSRHPAEDWRCDLEMEQFTRLKLKIE